MNSGDDNVLRHVFGPPGFYGWADDKHIVGLDEAETKEIVALAKENLGGNPHHNPRYRELYEKHHRAVMAKASSTKTEK